ncbi:MAG: alpha/beta hydrolase [Beijerinckiaceae bacterium]|jgi:pimeloyl-ACP methyl ester carboxylesterase|nr:alpha/beta hydrolase [Beijerinckiaceae bacterium]
MNGGVESFVDTPLGKTRVWTKGRGKRLCVLAGAGGAKKWTPFLEELSRSRKVIVPSLPGFPGGAPSEGLDQLMDWILAACDVVEAAGCLDSDMVGASIGATFAAEIAAFWPDNVKKLTLIAPFGLYDAAHPVADIFAQRPGAMANVLSRKPDELNTWLSPPEGFDPGEWEVQSLRANVATASIIWPLGDTRLNQRLWRIKAPTMVLWGGEDQVMAPAYAKLVAAAIGKNAKTKIVRNAGHMAEFDQPAAVARAVIGFCTDG